MTPEEELKKLVNELKTLTGRSINIDNVNNVAEAIRQVTISVENARNAAEELSDDFRATSDNLHEAYRAIEGIDKALKRSLTLEFRKVDSLVKSIRNNHTDLLKGYADEKQILANIKNIQHSINNIKLDNQQINKEEITDLINNLNLTKSVAETQLEIVQHSKAATENINEFSSLLSRIPIIGKTLAGPFKDIGTEIQKNTIKQQALNLQLQVYKQQQTDIERLVRLDHRMTATTIQGLKNQALGLRGVSDETKNLVLELESLEEQAKRAREELQNIPSPLSEIRNKILQLSLQGLAIGILTKAFITLKEAITAIDDQSTQLARSLSISKQQGLELRDVFNDIARDSSLMTKELVDAQLSFTKLTGLASALSDNNLTALAEATSLIGISEEAQQGLISFATTSGKELAEIEDALLGTSLITQIQNGLMMDQKQIMEEVLKTSASLRIQMKNNVGEITKAVVETKRLGFNLKDIEGIQSNLLQFESSIAAELEAELLTNKELNLEKARYFALTGNIRGLTQEINKNGVTALEFEKMTVLQRESFAKSLGLSVERLSEILLTQEQNDAIAKSLNGQQAVTVALQKAGLELSADGLATAIAKGIVDKDILKSLGESERALISQLSTQQQFNRTVENLKEVFVSLMSGPAGMFLDGFGSLLDKINKSPMTKYFTGGAMLVGLLGSIGLIGAAIFQLATKGTFMNPMFVKDISLGKPGMLGNILPAAGRGALGLTAGLTGFGAGSAIGGGGKGAMIGAGIGTSLGALGYLIPGGVGLMAGPALMALGGMAGGAIGGTFDEPSPSIKTNDAVITPSVNYPVNDAVITPSINYPVNDAVITPSVKIDPNPKDKIGFFMNERDSQEMISLLRIIAEKETSLNIGIQELGTANNMYSFK